MAVNNRYSAVSGSFMFLSFATAALLIVVQSHDLFGKSTVKPISNAVPPASETVAITPSAPVPATALSPVTEPALKVGLADILSNSLHPVALIDQPELVVDLSDRRVSLYKNNVLQASYEIAVGKAGWETPTGSFQILNMQENPIWQNPLTGEMVTNPSENPLGSRWIGFWSDGKHQIGFHGTNQNELIGQAVSHGCIRMRDAEIQALFSQVISGTPVTVQP